MMELTTHGFHVFPPFPDYGNTLESFHGTMDDFSEFLPLSLYAPRVLGGFSALGNPSSFHNNYVRYLRRHILDHLLPAFRELGKITNTSHVVQDFDRMLFRPAMVKPTSELWHRDIPRYKRAAVHYGGWINLGDHDQGFRCIPGSHLTNKSQLFSPGFHLFQKNTDKRKLKDQLTKLQTMSKLVVVPPGHILLFDSTILHTVEAKATPHAQYRLFLSFRLQTSNDDSDVQMSAISSQGVPLLPSGQTPPMYARLHLVNWRDRLSTFSDYFREDVPRDDKGFIPRVLPSLADMGLPLYDAYTDDDMRALTPMTIK